MNKNTKMTGTTRRLLAGSASAVALFAGFYGTAQAQENTAPSDASGLAEIIVTAQKREQVLQDVPASITALSGSALEANGVRSIVDLSGLAPNLTSVRVAGGSSLPSLTMRGARASASAPGSEKQIGIYIDGVYVGSNTGSVFDLASIDRIEVLRGPQGTLFGQSATGGAISIFTPDPTGTLGVKQLFTVGNQNQLRSSTHVDLPAWGPLSLSLTYEHNEHRGDVRNTGAGTKWDFSQVPESGLGVLTSPKWLGSTNSETIQAALKFEPSDDFQLTYKFYWVQTDATPNAAGNTGIDLATVSGFLGTAPAFFRDAVVSALTNYPVYLERPDAINNWYSMPSKFKNQGHIVTAKWNISDALSVKNTFGYMKNSFSSPGNQLDGIGGVYVNLGVPLPFAVLVNGTVGGNRQYSNELQLNYQSKLATITAGHLYYNINYVQGGVAFTDATIAFTPMPGFQVPRNSAATPSFNYNRANAVYGQAEIHVTPDLDLVGGLRYTWDRKSGSANFPGLPTSFTYRDSRPTYSLGVNYKPNSDLLLYAKYATAYVAGGSYAGVPWRPETAKSWEAGVKADLLDRKLRANLALFTVQYGAFQVPSSGQLLALTSGNPLLAQLPQVLVNVGDGRARGFELELTAAPVPGLLFGGSVGYTKFKYTRTDPLTLGPINLVRPQFRPEWTANLNAQYDTPALIGDAYLRFRIDGNYTGPYETIAFDPSPALAGLGHVKGTLLLNGRIALTKLSLAGADAEIAFWGRNLTNNRNIAFSFTSSFANNATYQPARTLGADLKFSF